MAWLHPGWLARRWRRFLDGIWASFRHSFPDLVRETYLFFGGESNGRVDGDAARDGRMWATGTGVMHAMFENDYVGIPAPGEAVSLGWGEFCCIEGGRISEVSWRPEQGLYS